MKNTSKRMETARFFYVYVFFLYMLLNQFSLYQKLPLFINQAAFLLLAAWGCILLAADLFTQRKLFCNPYCTYLVLFLLTCVLSSLLNARYGVGDNLKAVVLMAIQMFLMGAVTVGAERKDLIRGVRLMGETLVLVWFLGGLWSLGLFAVQFGSQFHGTDGDLVRMGYLGARLFGCYYDPNYASLLSLTAVIYSVWAMLQPGCSTVKKIYYVLTDLVQLLYLVLAYSRTAQIIFWIVGIALPVLYAVLPRWKGKFCFLRVTATLAALIISVPVFFFAVDAAREGLSYVPVLFTTEQGEQEQTESEKDTQDSGQEQDVPGKANIERNDVESFLVSKTRTRIWSSALDLYTQKPVFGASPRNYLQVGEELLGKDSYIIKRQATIHNGFLAVLVCTGTVGAVLIALWLGSCMFAVLRCIIRNRTAGGADYGLVLMLTEILIVMIIGCIPVMGIFFTNSAIEVIFWSSAGCLLSLLPALDPQMKGKKPAVLRCTDWLRSLISGKRKG